MADKASFHGFWLLWVGMEAPKHMIQAFKWKFFSQHRLPFEEISDDAPSSVSRAVNRFAASR